ncbi:hypothetical protein BH09MYX1_BH09MYX1_53310 [soil metagenome]
MRRFFVLVPILCGLFAADRGYADATAPPPLAAEAPWAWMSQSASPLPMPDGRLTDRETELQRACGVGELGLRRVAERLVQRKIKELPYLDLDGLTFAQRVNGEPHVWPRAWIVSARALDHETTVKKLAAWRTTFHDIGERRCGVASGYAPDGSQVVAAIALDAIADLTTPMPVKTHPGTWLTLEARLLVPTTGAHVVLIGPGGETRTVPTAVDGNVVRARFALDRPGGFTVQLVSDVTTGPRPALEAQIFADVEPPSVMPNLAAPGEAAGVGATDERDALFRMIAGLRVEQGLRATLRDPRLDTLAAAHAQRMKDAHTVGHDVGDGDPSTRLQRAGLSAHEAGENVAHAQTVALAHRALWASPSHRQNLQRPEYDRVGIAVLDDADGSVWACEIFAEDLH